MFLAGLVFSIEGSTLRDVIGGRGPPLIPDGVVDKSCKWCHLRLFKTDARKSEAYCATCIKYAFKLPPLDVYYSPILWHCNDGETEEDVFELMGDVNANLSELLRLALLKPNSYFRQIDLYYSFKYGRDPLRQLEQALIGCKNLLDHPRIRESWCSLGDLLDASCDYLIRERARPSSKELNSICIQLEQSFKEV